MKSSVDEILSKSEKWWKELEALREILLEFPLKEELKWGQPCYSYKKSNVAIIGELKDTCVIGFFRGALLADPENLLNKPGEHTQSARSLRFKNLAEIRQSESLIKAFILEAIEIEKAGLKVDFKEKNELEFPEELVSKFKELPEFQAAFEALTPGRQRAYILHFTAAKQSKTRITRIEKYVERILSGKGLTDW